MHDAKTVLEYHTYDISVYNQSKLLALLHKSYPIPDTVVIPCVFRIFSPLPQDYCGIHHHATFYWQVLTCSPWHVPAVNQRPICRHEKDLLATAAECECCHWKLTYQDSVLPAPPQSNTHNKQLRYTVLQRSQAAHFLRWFMKIYFWHSATLMLHGSGLGFAMAPTHQEITWG